MEKKTIVLKLDQIKGYEKNNKNHPREQIDAIKQSINEVGYLSDIIVDENCVILAGHGRFIALQELGHDNIGVQMVSGLTETQKKKFRIYDNITSDLGTYNIDNIKLEIDHIKLNIPEADLIQFTDIVCNALNIELDGNSDIKDKKPTNKEIDPDDLGDGSGKKVSCPNCGHEFIV